MYDPRSFLALLRQYEERPENFMLDLLDAGAVLYQLSYQANWELTVFFFGSKIIL